MRTIKVVVLKVMLSWIALFIFVYGLMRILIIGDDFNFLYFSVVTASFCTVIFTPIIYHLPPK